jgi:hypothetical protein
VIKAAMLRAGATDRRSPGIGEIPWRPDEGRETTDWKAVAGAYRGASSTSPS